MGGKEDEVFVFDDIVVYVSEMMEDEFDIYFVMGLGFMVGVIMEYLGFENILLGVDVVCQGK